MKMHALNAAYSAEDVGATAARRGQDPRGGMNFTRLARSWSRLWGYGMKPVVAPAGGRLWRRCHRLVVWVDVMGPSGAHRRGWGGWKDGWLVSAFGRSPGISRHVVDDGATEHTWFRTFLLGLSSVFLDRGRPRVKPENVGAGAARWSGDSRWIAVADPRGKNVASECTDVCHVIVIELTVVWERVGHVSTWAPGGVKKTGRSSGHVGWHDVRRKGNQCRRSEFARSAGRRCGVQPESLKDCEPKKVEIKTKRRPDSYKTVTFVDKYKNRNFLCLLNILICVIEEETTKKTIL